MDVHEPSKMIGVRNVLSITSQRLMPSTPRAYWTPMAGIHSWSSVSW